MTIGSRGSERVKISEIDPTAKTSFREDQPLITGQNLIRNLVYQFEEKTGEVTNIAYKF